MHRKHRFSVVMLAFAVLVAAPAAAQAEENEYENAVLLSANLLSPIVGVYTGSVEFGVSPDVSVFIQPAYFNLRWSLLWVLFEALEPELRNVDLNVTSIGGAAGAHYFPDGVHDGFFVGPGLAYSRLRLRYEGRQGTGSNFYGGVRGGYRFIAGPIAITPLAELGLTYSTIDYRAFFADLGLSDAELRALFGRRFGISWGLGISFALALY